MEVGKPEKGFMLNRIETFREEAKQFIYFSLVVNIPIFCWNWSRCSDAIKKKVFPVFTTNMHRQSTRWNSPQRIRKFLIVAITVGDQEYDLKPGDYMSMPLHINHHVCVTSPVPCKIILQRVAAQSTLALIDVPLTTFFRKLYVWNPLFFSYLVERCCNLPSDRQHCIF